MQALKVIQVKLINCATSGSLDRSQCEFKYKTEDLTKDFEELKLMKNSIFYLPQMWSGSSNIYH